MEFKIGANKSLTLVYLLKFKVAKHEFFNPMEVETRLLNRWWEPQIPGREAWIRRYRGAIMIKKRLFFIEFLLNLLIYFYAFAAIAFKALK